MSDVKSDIQIAREAKMQPIKDILAKINVPDESSAFSPMGRHIAKINLVAISDTTAYLIPHPRSNVDPQILEVSLD